MFTEEVTETKCPGCDTVIASGDSICDDCFTCEHCEKVFLSSEIQERNSSLYCEECADKLFAQCRACYYYFSHGDTIESRGGRTYCCDCATACDECGYGSTDTRENGRGDYLCNSCWVDEHEEVIKCSSTRAPDHFGFLGAPKDKLFFGVELEVECRSNNDIYQNAVEVNETLQGFGLCKEDCSVNNGFEIVTAPATLDIHYEKWAPFFKGLNQKFRNRGASNGMHIHFSRRGATPSQLARMIVFLHESKNLSFVEMIAGRSLTRGNGGNYSPLESGAIDQPITKFVGALDQRYSERPLKKALVT